MASITAAGIGSGLDIASLVSQLVSAESSPQSTRLDSAETKTKAQISAVGTLRGALSTLATSLAALKANGAFTKRTATSSDTASLGVTATATAAPGTHAVTIDRLASAHRLASTGFPASTTTIGTGTLTIANADGKTFDLAIASGANSLEKIRDAINAATGNTFVDASIVNAADGAHLVLSARATGAKGELRITQAGGDGGLAALVHDPGNGSAMTEKAAALDAQITVDGFSHVSASNSVTGVLDGITLDLKKAELGVARTVTVGRDDAAALAAVQAFVTGYNVVNASISTVTRYDATTKTASALTGDVLPRSIAGELRGVIGSVRDSGTLRALSDVGVSFTSTGALQVDAAKFNAKLAADPAAVADFFGGTGGIATKLATVVDKLTGSGGRLQIRTDSLNDKISDIADRRLALERRIDDLTKRYQTQFTALDTIVAKMKSTSSFLSQQLGTSSSS